MRQIWAKRKAQAQGYQQAPIIAVKDDPAKLEKIRQETREAIRENVQEKAVIPITGDKWNDLPLAEAHAELAKLQAEIKHATDVITRRTTYGVKIWTCFTALHHKDLLADLPGVATVYGKCLKRIVDGKEKFTDNCWIDPQTKLIDPARCCSTPCITLYQVYQARVRYKQRTEQP
jgi:hypothetical protein